MYQITEHDQQILFRVEYTDKISKLTMFEPATLAALTLHHIAIMADLATIEPVWLTDISSITDGEKEKLDAVCRFLFKGAYDNLHG